MRSKILVVEDEAITALDIQGLLERVGFEVVSTASSGIEAIQKARDLKPDLILMDVTLKGEMDGIEAAERIMTLFDIPVIYLTGYSDEKTFERIKLTQPYGFITKPIGYDELRATIETALYKHKLDKKLKESEERYRQWFEEDLTGNFVVTPKGELLNCNSAFMGVYGFANHEEALMYNISEFNPIGWIDLIATLKKEKKIKNYESWHKRPDGKQIYIVANVIGVFNDSNELVLVKGYVLDNTEIKKAEENFNKEVEREHFLLELYKKAPKLKDKELYNCVLDHAVSLTDSAIGFFHIISDDQKTIILDTWNNEALRTCKTSFRTHYPIEEAGNWTDCIKIKGPVVYNDFKNSPNRKGFPEGHVPVKRFISIPIFDGDKVKFIFGVGNKIEEYDDHDVIQIQSVANELYRISKQRHWEQELKEAKDTLEEQVEERTVEIEEAYNSLKENESQLKEAVKELERSNEELQSFAYITSHDLQEPLRTIASFTQLMERRYKGKLDSDADEFMEYIVDAAVRMKEMIQGLLDYSRVGRTDNQFVKVDMNVKLEKAIFNLKSSIDESNAEITHDELPTVNADPSQMVRVFQNLISNSIKFKKPQFPPRIHISAEMDTKKYEWIFSVNDNGIGIEKPYKDQVFQVFKRLHAIGEYEGTGIGLAIVKRIIEYHGGRIWVKSEPGLGSTFYFTLPKP